MNIEEEFSKYLNIVYKDKLPLHDEQYSQLRDTWVAANAISYNKLVAAIRSDNVEELSKTIHNNLMQFVNESK